MPWSEIKDPTSGELLARVDLRRNLLELPRKKTKVLIDLVPYLPKKESAQSVASVVAPESTQASE
jgi:hypothetical protein